MSVISRMNVGGPAVLLSELMNKLPDHSIDHILITGICEANEIDFLANHVVNSEVIYIPSLGRSISPINDLKGFFTLINIIRSLKPDVVHTHTSKAGLLGRLATFLASPKTPIIHTYHGHLLYGYFSPIFVRALVLLEKILGLVSDRLIGVSQQIMNDLKFQGIGSKGKWLVIHPGISEPTFISKADARAKLSISTETFAITWIGRFTEIKNPLLAIQAIEKLNANSLTSITLFMAGDGELLEKCRDYVSSKKLPVIFLGWVDNPAILISASDLLLISSKNEGLPVVLVEAAIQGVPALATNVGGIADFINDGETGWLGIETADDIARLIQLILRNLENYQYVSSNVKKLADSEYSLKQFISKHVAIYRELAGK